MTLVPGLIPVTRPPLFTVAIPGLDEVQAVAAGVPEPASKVVDPLHKEALPVMVGNAFTVTVTLLVQPLLLVKETIVVPAAIPVTSPVLLTVATPALDDVHGFEGAGVPDPVNVVVAPWHILSVPLIV